MRNRALPVIFVLLILALIAVGVIYGRGFSGKPTPEASISSLPSLEPSPSPSASIGLTVSKATNLNPDLTLDTNGLSKATVALNTSQGLIKFKFYPQDAPMTVKRMIELVNQGFYNGIVFHRVEPGFVIQTGDPSGTGSGGSGTKLKAEFSDRRHIEGTVAMARTSERDSADSQFYISLATLPSLDHSYTVFGQVIEGMDVARKIKKGDTIVSMIVE